MVLVFAGPVDLGAEGGDGGGVGVDGDGTDVVEAAFVGLGLEKIWFFMEMGYCVLWVRMLS